MGQNGTHKAAARRNRRLSRETLPGAPHRSEALDERVKEGQKG